VRRSSFFVFLLALVSATVRPALADVIPPIGRCAPWERPVFHHGSLSCAPRACVDDHECGSGHCYNVACMCLSGDDVLGACDPRGRCTIGAPARRGLCGR
jgi:hypothetical protein